MSLVTVVSGVVAVVLGLVVVYQRGQELQLKTNYHRSTAENSSLRSQLQHLQV